MGTEFSPRSRTPRPTRPRSSKATAGPDGLNPDRIMGRVAAALDHLLSHPDARGEQAGIIALSFGGWYGSHVAASRSKILSPPS